jgi:hypothetical protein
VVVTSSGLADALVAVAEAFLAGKVAGAEDAEVYQVVIHAGTDVVTAAAGTGPDPAPAASAGPAGVSAETPGAAPAPAPPGDPADPGRCHVEDGAAISVSTAHMLGCTAALSWMRHARDGTILDLGRRRRRPNAALRKAARDRDRGRCRYPGCESRRVDLHHIQHWADGGRTCLENLVSLCKRHHMAIHDRGYLIAAGPGGVFTFYGPDGAVIPASPPLPAPDGTIGDVHDAEVTPETIIPPWSGERLDLDYAIYTCLANEKVRADRAAGRDPQDDLPPHHPGLDEPVYVPDWIRSQFSDRPAQPPNPYAPTYLPVEV